MNLSKRNQRIKDLLPDCFHNFDSGFIALLRRQWFFGTRIVLVFSALLLMPFYCFAGIDVTDDSGHRVHLQQPARRIISLAPHITELLYEIGAGDRIVGTVEYSDYPAAAKNIRRIGRYNGLDLEAIVTLKPDLVIAWRSGNPVHQVEKIIGLGIPVFYSDPVKLTDVADSLRRFGRLTGSTGRGRQAQQAFMQRYRQLKKRYQHKSKVRVFYEIWNPPMMTVNGKHIINEVIQLCGGENVFKTLPSLTPTVNIEAVLAADPAVIIASGVGEGPPPWLAQWNRWQDLSAVKNRHIYYVNPDYIHRQTSRILTGAQRVCELLDKARETDGR
jgi:iron complex transport system substrate-binding protein